MTQSDAPPTPEVDPDIAPPKPRRPRQNVAPSGGPVIDPAKADRIRVDDQPAQVADDEPDPQPQQIPITTLSDEDRGNFASLMTVGRRSKHLQIADHDVTIQSLTVSDELRIGIYTKPFMGSQSFSHAYRIGVVASGVREINNQPVFRTLKQLSPDEYFDKAVHHFQDYYPIVIDRLYTAIMNLDREFAEMAIALGKLPG